MCLMLNIVDMYSQTLALWCHRYRRRDVINPGGDVICRETDVMNAVVVMSYSGCPVV